MRQRLKVVSDLHVLAVRWADRLPRWAGVVLVVVLLAVAWTTTFLAGGTQTAWPHLFYLPVLVAALLLGPAGGLVTGLAAMLLCGPAMPLDVAAGQAQQLVNWAARGAFFVIVGTLSGASVQALRISFEQGLAAWFRQEFEQAVAEPPGDPQVRDQIGGVLADRRLRTVFQPIYSLDDGRLLAVEALTRFEAEPYRPPNLWFEQAHAVGLGVDLELAAIDSALSASRELSPDVTVAVNASPAALADPRMLVLLDHHPQQVTVEITEHAVVDDYPQLEAVLGDIRRRGVSVAVDDAGAGFASLRHIVRLAPDFIKLDHSLTQHVVRDPVRRALATSLVSFVHETGASLIAEGIEEPADLAAWQQLGAQAAQGYLLGRPGPLPAAPVSELIPRRIPDLRLVSNGHPRRQVAQGPR